MDAARLFSRSAHRLTTPVQSATILIGTQQPVTLNVKLTTSFTARRGLQPEAKMGIILAASLFALLVVLPLVVFLGIVLFRRHRASTSTTRFQHPGISGYNWRRDSGKQLSFEAALQSSGTVQRSSSQGSTRSTRLRLSMQNIPSGEKVLSIACFVNPDDLEWDHDSGGDDEGGCQDTLEDRRVKRRSQDGEHWRTVQNRRPGARFARRDLTLETIPASPVMSRHRPTFSLDRGQPVLPVELESSGDDDLQHVREERQRSSMDLKA